ncbi:MAG: glycerol kinase GlpK [Pseudomonadota bacterium]
MGIILAIDQGTTSSRALVFSEMRHLLGLGQREFTQHFPKDGWVEHDADEIFESVVDVCRFALANARVDASDVAAIGITNQRETTVLWDRVSGKPLHRAIVWQDRRTEPLCEVLRTDGTAALITERTGLLADPYFSGTKLAWLLDNIEGAREAAEAGRLAFGTIDSFLIYRLTGNKRHVTDATNASRTLLFDIHKQDWDSDLLERFQVPRSVLPDVLDCAADFGTTEPDILGAALPIAGVAGDQQAALIGQACYTPGMMKSTYGTGCFALINTGDEAAVSKNRLLTTPAYRLSGKVTYALEGAIFVAGAAVQWLRDGLDIMGHAAHSDQLAARADPNEAIYMVPAFVGLGAPYWDADARGAIFGLTRATGRAEIVRATLEAVCYQTRDLLEAMAADRGGFGETVLRVDGGMVASDWTMQALADIIGAPVERPEMLETTALGAAWLAGYHRSVWPDQQAFQAEWRGERTFRPQMGEAMRDKKYAGWKDAISRTFTKR